ncbi:MAG: hypothetical protein JW795_15830 [Chitinivibrionales bacterium]|nr:hypothetical protein [Chitinivibrionales bacterium]
MHLSTHVKSSPARLYPILILSLFAAMALHGETQLQGILNSCIFDSSANPYVVVDDISIAKGSRCEIKPGVVFLFKRSVGLNVYGTLIVEGIDRKPVVFTSYSDSAYNSSWHKAASPFDWSGLFIFEKADSVFLSHFLVAYSTYGIKSDKDSIRIENGILNYTGQFHVTIDNTVHYVQDGNPFSYPEEEQEEKTLFYYCIPQTPDTQPKTERQPVRIIPAVSLKPAFSGVVAQKENSRFKLIGATVALGSASAFSGGTFFESHRKLLRIEKIPGYKNVDSLVNSYVKLQKRRDRYKTVFVISSMATLMTSGFLLYGLLNENNKPSSGSSLTVSLKAYDCTNETFLSFGLNLPIPAF